MANRFLEGLDFLASTQADILTRFESASFSGSSPSINVGGGRFGGNCLRWVGSNATNVTKGLDAQGTWIVGFAFKHVAASATGAILRLLDGTVLHVKVSLNASTGKLEIYRNTTLLATGSTALLSGVWYYLEFKIVISDTAGVTDMYVNGVLETITYVTGTSTTQDTRNGGNASANNISIGGDGSQNGTSFDVDDIYIHDGTGGVDDAVWGDIRIVEKTVDGAGNYSQFTPSAGSNWQNIDDATPNGDTDYNESSTVNHIDTGTTAALGFTGTVKGVGVSVYARKTDAGAGSLAPLWRISGTDYAGTGVALPTNYIYVTQLYRVSPATSSAWTTTEIDGAEVGYKRTA